MPYNASADMWYQYFKRDDGPQAVILLSFYGGLAFFATFGVLFNASIVYVTIKSKSLHGVCNILIALESFFSLVMDAGFYAGFLVQLFGRRFLRFDQCFWFVLPLSIIGNVAQMTMVFTGLDRLLAVLFPFWYNNRSKTFHFLIVGTVLILYAIYFGIIEYIDFHQSRDVLVTCSANVMGQTAAIASIMRVTGLTLSGTIMIIYSLLWFIVFQLKNTINYVSEKNRKLIKSLIFLISLNLFGVFFRLGVSLLFTLFPPNMFIKWGFSNVGTFLIIIVYSANAPVLFTISYEYRAEFIRHFKWLTKVIRFESTQSQVVKPINVTKNTNSVTHMAQQPLNNVNQGIAATFNHPNTTSP